MEGMGIWIFLLLFYLLQALTKRKRKQKEKRQEQVDAPSQKTQRVPTSQESSESQKSQAPQRPVSLEDLFNPNKLRDILGVPQPVPVEIPKPKPIPKPALAQNSENDISGIWDDLDQSELSQPKQKIRETASKVASADITDVDESTADFKAHRMAKSDIASDRFGERKTAPGKKEKVYTLEYFDEPEDIRNAVILKEILDRPRAFRRQIR